LLFGDKKLLFN